MRKLVRQALIFGLLGLFVATIGIFAKLDADARRTARTQAAQAVHAHDDRVLGQEPSNPIVVVTLDNGTILHVRQCLRSDPRTAYETVDRMMAALERKARGQQGASPPSYNLPPRNDSALPKPVETLDCRNFSSTPFDRASLQRDYWIAYRESKQQTLAENVHDSFVAGLLGFPVGLAVWIFRLVRKQRFAAQLGQLSR